MTGDRLNDEQLDELLKDVGAAFRRDTAALLAEDSFRRKRRAQISAAVLAAGNAKSTGGLGRILASALSRPITLGAAAATAFAVTLVLVSPDGRSTRRGPAGAEQLALLQDGADDGFTQLAMADAYRDFQDDFHSELSELGPFGLVDEGYGSFGPDEMPALVADNQYLTEEETPDEIEVEWF